MTESGNKKGGSEYRALETARAPDEPSAQNRLRKQNEPDIVGAARVKNLLWEYTHTEDKMVPAEKWTNEEKEQHSRTDAKSRHTAAHTALQHTAKKGPTASEKKDMVVFSCVDGREDILDGTEPWDILETGVGSGSCSSMMIVSTRRRFLIKFGRCDGSRADFQAKSEPFVSRIRGGGRRGGKWEDKWRMGVEWECRQWGRMRRNRLRI